jgi:erythromycin esterase-like protein
MIAHNEQDLVHMLRTAVRRLDRPDDACGPLLDLIGDSRFVLIGEASHGTHEFYDARARLTRRLIEEKGFTAVVAEADWPDAYRVNRYARGFTDDANPAEALAGFRRFPQWMWRNTVMIDFVSWLKDHNARATNVATADRPQCGFYGMDLYSLGNSIQAVLKYLDQVDPDAARRARYRYSCFEDFGEDPQAYGYAAGFDLSRSCEKQVIQQLLELLRHAGAYARRDGRAAEDEYFFAAQNARLVRNAEEYYREMFTGGVSTWNLRDRHMTDTIDALTRFLDQQRGGRAPTKVVVWAHNSHLGDARAIDMGEQGEVNVGSLAREKWGGEVFNVGFSTYTGTVTAASNWDEDAQLKRVRPGLPGSWESVFHEVGGDFVLPLRNAAGDLSVELRHPRLQRAIGVIYRPQTERISHYFHTRLAAQFDAMIHLDRTRALEPLERTPAWDPAREFETFPSGI